MGLRSALLLLALFGPAASAAEAPPCVAEDDLSAFTCATGAWRAQRWEEALRWLRKAESLRPRARYVYNRALVLERLGRYTEAKAQLARVGAMPDATEDDRRLAQARTEGLAPRLRAAELVLPAEARLQVGEVVLSSGEHLVSGAKELYCWPTGSQTRCRSMALEVGRRHPWPLDAGVLHGVVDLSAWAPVEARLAGRTVLFDASQLRLDAGRHQIEVAGQRHAVIVRPEEAAVVARPPPPRAPATWPWVVGGVGVVSAAAGATLLTMAAGDSERMAGETEREAEARWEDRNSKLSVGWPLASVGLVALSVGVTWLLLDR